LCVNYTVGPLNEDTSLIRTLSLVPKGVCNREVPLYLK
jgi:hypothetical protein